MTTTHLTQCDETAAFLRSRLPEADKCGTLVIAGSGLGGFVRGIDATARVPYGEIPNVGGSTVVGHAGELILGRLPQAPTSVLVMAGRRHFYEGIGAQNSVLLSKALLLAFPSLKSVIISNAA